MADANTTETTTVAKAAEQNLAEKQGEQVIDQSAEAHGLKEQTSEERLEAARNEALANHATEHAGDTESQESLASRDKVEE